MKIRQGFVSNSSSSSFICVICGNVESGWDLSLSDVNMRQCINGHEWHEGCVENKTEVSDIEKIQYLKEFAEAEYNKKWYPKWVAAINSCNSLQELEDDFDEYDAMCAELLDDNYDVPEFNCPVCRLDVITEKDALLYLMKVNSYKTVEDVLVHVKNDFTSYVDFRKYITEK